MFSLISLYKDYAHQSTRSLIGLIESELSDYPEFGHAYVINALKECISFTEDYINHNLKDADNKAKNEKGEYVRFSGEPYINHCLRVALILIHERLFDEDVLKAAIMHDLFEDTTFSYAEAYKICILQLNGWNILILLALSFLVPLLCTVMPLRRFLKKPIVDNITGNRERK